MTNTERVLEAWAQLDQLAHDLLNPISNDGQYRVALAFVDDLMTRAEQDGNPALASLLTLISERVETYEEEHHPVPASNPSRVLAFLMEQRDLTQSALAEATGIDQSNLSKLLKGERELNTRQIKILSDYFKVSPAVFIA